MHTFSETGAGVPAFLAKLWRLVEDPETNNLICWSKDGRSFIIQNQAQFARELLPLNYKHNNMASFIRQLNMYGFHKITSIDNGGLKFDRDDMEFSHPCFKRDCPQLLEHIKRKIANAKTIDDKAAVKPEAATKVLNDVKAMRGRQDSLDSKFSVLKQENEALWREIASLRQKHAKQQQIVNKLIQFLISIVQPSRNMTSVKRNMQLMINGITDQPKLRKDSEAESNCGPVIHELEEELFDEAVENDAGLDEPSSPYSPSPTPKLERPPSSNSANSHILDCSNQTAEDATYQLGNVTPCRSDIINTVNPDGTNTVYHVTEVDMENPNPEIFNDENHISTPLVKAMNRNQNKNKLKRKGVTSTITSSSTSPIPSAKMLRTENETNQLRIKTEQSEIDPMVFFNENYIVPNSANAEAGPLNITLTDPYNLSFDVNPIENQTTFISPTDEESQTSVINKSGSDLYNPNNFIESDIPVELFEDAPIIDNNNIVSANNFSKFDFKPSSSGIQQLKSKSTEKECNENGDPSSTSDSKMQVSKLKNSKDENLRLSTLNELNTHVEGVQDDLNTLKDLLRSDSYSFDANTLLGLFTDSDILGPYGLSVNQSPDASQEKKGSELMTYQPMYDLSDIMNINDDSNNNGNNTKTVSPPNSVLNTPYHD